MPEEPTNDNQIQLKGKGKETSEREGAYHGHFRQTSITSFLRMHTLPLHHKERRVVIHQEPHMNNVQTSKGNGQKSNVVREVVCI